jgi:hypothetical protein
MKKRQYAIITILLIILLSSCVEVQPSDVTSVTVNFTPKAAYLAGETVVLDDYEVEVFFETQDPMTFTLDDTDVSLEGGFYEDAGLIKLDTQTAGDQSLFISYGDVSVSVEYSVYDAIVTTTGYKLENDINERVSNTPINSAIDEIDDHDWIFVQDGIYEEISSKKPFGDNFTFGIVIDKPLTMKASESVTLSPPSAYATILSKLDGTLTINDIVTIEGFTIDDTWTNVGLWQHRTNNTPIHILDNWIKAPEMAASNGNSIQFSGSGSRVNGNTIFVTENPGAAANWASSGIVLGNEIHSIVENIGISDNTIMRDVGTSNNNLAISINNFYNIDRDSNENMTIKNLVIENNTIQGGITSIQFNHYHFKGEDPFSSVMSNISVINNTMNETEVGIVVTAGTWDQGQSKVNATMTNLTIENNTYRNSEEVLWVIDSLTDALDFSAFLNNNDFNGQVVERVDGDTYSSYVVETDE